MILTWLKGPRANYYHSEGACCRSDLDVNGDNIHAECKIDEDYTLRMELIIGRYKAGDAVGNSAPPAWCNFCDGFEDACVFCHTAEQLITGKTVSERKEALGYLLAAWPAAPKEYYNLTRAQAHNQQEDF